MKTTTFISLLLLAFGVMLSSCSKDAGYDSGSRSITGNVSYQVDQNVYQPAPGALVYIKFGSKDATTNFDASTVADDNGHYKFGGLNKGDYYVFAKYTDPNGFTHKGGGSGVTLDAKKGEFGGVDLKLQ